MRDEAKNRAFYTLLGDLVENILRYADNPAAYSKYVTTQIRELIGVRLVALVVNDPETGFSLIGICPPKKEAEWNRPEIRSFVSSAFETGVPRLIDPGTDPGFESLASVGIGKSFVIPLLAGEEKVGLLVLLDLMEEEAASIILEALARVSRVIALVVKNSLLFKNLERTVESRTEQLSKSEKLFRTLFEQSAVGVAQVRTKSDRIIRINKRFCDILGRSPADMLESDLKAIAHPEDTRIGVEEMARLVSGRIREFSVDKRYVHRNGHPVWVNLSVSPMWGEGADEDCYIAVVKDITVHKSAEEALKESEARMRLAVASSPIPMMIHDEDGRVLQLSNGWTNFSGYTLEDIATVSDWTERAYGERTGTKKEYIDNLFEIERTTCNGEWIVTAKDGSKRIWDFQTTPLGKVSNGKRVLLSMATDITERKRTEAEREKLQAELQQAMKMEAVGRLAGGVAHDFNNLLTVITGYSELLLQKVGKESPMRGELEEIKRAGERAAALTQQLLAFSRKQIIEPKVVYLDRLVAEVHGMLARLIGEDIAMQTTTGKSPGSVKIDPGQFQQILVNLAVNARDAMPGGGRIVIETANADLDEGYCALHPYVTPGRYVMLAVSDTGEGMSEEVKAHIFEPFFTTKERGSGTGLGLATTYGVVRQAGGSIEVDSEVGKGTTFRIYLPRVEEATAKPVKEDLPRDLPGGSETVLLVEDEEMVRGLCVQVLEQLRYRVLQARNGAEAIGLAQRYGDRIDLLLTDVVMPGMNGSELAAQLVLYHPKMKVLFMSGYTDDAISRHGVLDEGVSFIGKPYSPERLAWKIREVMDNT